MAQPDTPAPWAEPAPNVGPMTVDELAALPADGWRYELVGGRLVRMAPTSGIHGSVALELGGALRDWVKPRGLGQVLAAEAGFQLGPDTVLAGDVAFVRADRIPAEDSPDLETFWALVPDLVAEVVSPSDRRPGVEAKARQWVAAGVRLVWVVWPKQRQVDVWRPDAAGAPQRTATLGSGDTLDGLDVLPGFTHPVVDLFTLGR